MAYKNTGGTTRFREHKKIDQNYGTFDSGLFRRRTKISKAPDVSGPTSRGIDNIDLDNVLGIAQLASPLLSNMFQKTANPVRLNADKYINEDSIYSPELIKKRFDRSSFESHNRNIDQNTSSAPVRRGLRQNAAVQEARARNEYNTAIDNQNAGAINRAKEINSMQRGRRGELQYDIDQQYQSDIFDVQADKNYRTRDTFASVGRAAHELMRLKQLPNIYDAVRREQENKKITRRKERNNHG